jgi:hypothetical protein
MAKANKSKSNLVDSLQSSHRRDASQVRAALIAQTNGVLKKISRFEVWSAGADHGHFCQEFGKWSGGQLLI